MNERIGEVKLNHFGTEMKIVRYENSDNIDVQFLDDNFYIYHNTTYSNFKSGCIKNPYDKSVFGVGYIGVGKYQTRINGVNTIYYNTWCDMLRRCYHEGVKDKFSSYFGICAVCSRWLNLQDFGEWFETNRYECGERLHIDKDILYPGNKIYSPDTCLLVPQRINMLFLNKPNKRGFPNGIDRTKSGKYSVVYSGEKLGIYKTLEDAYSIYADAKKKAIIRIANEYHEIIPDKLYKALLEYEVRIDIDKNYVA